MTILNFVKRNIVLCVAWILAIVSMFIVVPGKEYISYIDIKTLGVLWTLMVIMQVFQELGVFSDIGTRLLRRTKNAGQLSLVLILLCFFLAMFITNDVALLTFVPFAIMMLEKCDREDLLVPVIVLQTMAANLGSMMLPVGSPQNLYLFGISGIGAGEFIKLMLPYGVASLALILGTTLLFKGRKAPIHSIYIEDDYDEKDFYNFRWRIIYALLFLLSLIYVARLIPWYAPAILVFIFTAVFDRKIILKVDYSLLMTFVGFFIFTGNITRMDFVSQFLEQVIEGRTVVVSTITSQFVSNVPAALLLSNFTDDVRGLIVGTNFGGLGTLIASMANLISFKLYAASEGAKSSKFIGFFSILSVIYLIVLGAIYIIVE